MPGRIRLPVNDVHQRKRKPLILKPSHPPRQFVQMGLVIGRHSAYACDALSVPSKMAFTPAASGWVQLLCAATNFS